MFTSINIKKTIFMNFHEFHELKKLKLQVGESFCNLTTSNRENTMTSLVLNETTFHSFPFMLEKDRAYTLAIIVNHGIRGRF